MSASYTVIPLNKEVISWLKSLGLAYPLPLEDSRYPTHKELERVLLSLNGYSVEKSYDKHDLHITISKIGNPQVDPWMSLIVTNFDQEEVEEGNSPTFYFDKGWIELFIQILKELSKTCGPLVLTAHSGKQPLLIGPDIDIAGAVNAWK